MNLKLPEKWKKALSKIFTKDKLPLILLFGLLLIVINLPVKSASKNKSGAASQEDSAKTAQTDVRTSAEGYVKDLENGLERLLSQTYGVGEARVMISVKNSGRNNIFVQKNVSKSQSEEKDSAGGSRSQTEYSGQESVVYTNEGGSNSPYVTEEEMPEILGVIIIAEGAGDAKIVSDITEAASALLGISVNKIKVLKMEV
ncbi:MAG: hypothetical protein NC223_09200 [Butyrivibrio sp.]|nr:hypothetical protein [Butyrivibrio sp.]